MSYYIMFNYLQCILTYIYVDKSKQRAKYCHWKVGWWYPFFDYIKENIRMLNLKVLDFFL